MSNIHPPTLRVQWTITPRTEPQPWLHCSRCRGPRSFRSSGRIRLNANGRLVDAWLVYRCADCDGTWNRPIVERRAVGALDREYLEALQSNAPTLVRTLAFDIAALKRWTDRVQEFDDVRVTKCVLEEPCLMPVLKLEIECRVPHPISLRTDRLLAGELRLPRSAVQRMAKAGMIRTVSEGADLRRPVRDGMQVVVETAQAVPSVCFAQ